MPQRHSNSRPPPGMDEDTYTRRSASLTAGSSRLPGQNRTGRTPSRSPDIPEVDENRQTSAQDKDGETGFWDTGSSDHELDEMGSDSGLEDDEETGLTGQERRKKRRRKRLNARLDRRVAGNDINFTEEEDKIATKTVLKTSLFNALLICLWYLFSVSISVYNKWMFKKPDPEDDPNSAISFPFPLFTTCMHMIVQFTLASLVLFFFPQFRPRHDSLDPHQPENLQRREPVDPSKPLMTKWFYISRLGPCGAATGMDIGLGNMSLKYITLTFYTMCKSTVLAWVLIFAFLFRLEKPSWRLGGIIFTMTVGVIMMVAGETTFSVLGFILIESAAASSGFRWSLTQILLLRNPATSNPFSSIFFLAPIMFLSLLIIALPIEGPREIAMGLATLMQAKGTLVGTLLLLFPGCLAFCMTASEFALLQRTNVVTLSVCGIFKEVVTIIVAAGVFGDKMTPINVSGVLITIACIAYYNYLKVTKMKEDARIEAHLANTSYAAVPGGDPDAQHLSNENTPSRSNASNLMRNGFSIPPKLLGSDRSDGSAKVSPIKRPEDLD